MKDLIHIKSPFQEMVSEAKTLTADEYLQLGELFRQFKESGDKDNVIGDINMYIDRFPLDSKVVLYFNNWSKMTTQSDSYMNLVLHLRKLSESIYEDKYFLKLL